MMLCFNRLYLLIADTKAPRDSGLPNHTCASFRCHGALFCSVYVWIRCQPKITDVDFWLESLETALWKLFVLRCDYMKGGICSLPFPQIHLLKYKGMILQEHSRTESEHFDSLHFGIITVITV